MPLCLILRRFKHVQGLPCRVVAGTGIKCSLEAENGPEWHNFRLSQGISLPHAGLTLELWNGHTRMNDHSNCCSAALARIMHGRYCGTYLATRTRARFNYWRQPILGFLPVWPVWSMPLRPHRKPVAAFWPLGAG